MMTAALASRQALAAGAAQCTAQWEQLSRTHQTGALTRQTFMTACLSGVAPPTTPIVDAPGNAPPSAAYRCRDGMYAVMPTGCAIHRGVAARLR